MNVIDEWVEFLKNNWQWFIPLMMSFSAPIIASVINIAYDYAKTKGWIK